MKPNNPDSLHGQVTSPGQHIGPVASRPPVDRSLGELETAGHSPQISTSNPDLQEAAEHLDDVEFEQVDLARLYDIQGEIGQGGMGVVYRAIERSMRRPVAIKRLKPELVANRRALARFHSEAIAVAALSHENIVRIYRIGRDEISPFLILELVEGGNLAERIAQGPLALDEAVRMFVGLSSGLALSHRRGIIHRDIKPGNILLTAEGVAKLTDFGIAHQDDREGLTSTGAVIGTLAYMAPEQHRGAEFVTARTDLFSLAKTLYHALTGERPDTVRESRLPEPIRDLTMRALEHEPEKRHSSLDEFAAELREVQLQLTAPAKVTAPSADLKDGECPSCHTINPTTRKFCKTGSCGKALYDPCPSCQTSTPVWETICAECGTNIPDHWEDAEQYLELQAQQIGSLAAELRHSEAIAALQPFLTLAPSRWKSWKDWAQETVATQQALLSEQETLCNRLFGEAQAAFQSAKYPLVASLLDQIHASQITPEIRSLRASAISRGLELDQLIENLKQQVKVNDYDGLRRNVDRVLSLSPGDSRVAQLNLQLTEREETIRRKQQQTAEMDRQIRYWSCTHPGDAREITFPGGLTHKLLWCPPGRFTMGSPVSERWRNDNEKQVLVSLTKGFWLGQTVVTQAMWTAVMKTRPWSGEKFVKEGPDYPVVFIDHSDATAFCDELTKIERFAGRLPADWKYALPSEAQWEYACRAGTTTAYSYGDDVARLKHYAWFEMNAYYGGEKYAHAVGTKKANPWGFFDMHGNVWEWCRDWYSDYLSGGTDPLNASSAVWRVLRGGTWNNESRYTRSANRNRYTPDVRHYNIGFRIVRTQ